ncbi:MAG: NIL domain-containing protein [Nitrospira sp.]|nr:NIL domain-containing protein [Nitrospira sp.]
MKTRIKLTFPQDLIREPVIFEMAKKYDIMPNIRRAKITASIGEIILELDGEEQNVQQGIEHLRQQGINIELIEGDILE